MSTTTSKVIETTFSITKGPSASDITNSLLYAFSPNKLYLSFTGEARDEDMTPWTLSFEAVAVGVAYESGAPGMLLVRLRAANGYEKILGKVVGFYNANTRRGTLQIELLQKK